MTREPIGDPDEEQGDFADEHAQFEVQPEEADEGETESPGGWSGGMDGDGAP